MLAVAFPLSSLSRRLAVVAAVVVVAAAAFAAAQHGPVAERAPAIERCVVAAVPVAAVPVAAVPVAAVYAEPSPHATWRGHDVRVHAELTPRTHYATADIAVAIDGVDVVHSGGVWDVVARAQSDTVWTWTKDVAPHNVDLGWYAAEGGGFPVDVVIDGEPVIPRSIVGYVDVR